jgi:hypothetical protein
LALEDRFRPEDIEELEARFAEAEDEHRAKGSPKAPPVDWAAWEDFFGDPFP